MPRAFSSGALSIESKLRNFTFGLCLASVLVIAAVSVVFPWSMCPIVPMLTCGLLRSNFSFAIYSLLASTEDVASSQEWDEPLPYPDPAADLVNTNDIGGIVTHFEFNRCSTALPNGKI